MQIELQTEGTPEAGREQSSGIRLTCVICPHRCELLDGETGKCGVRQRIRTRITNPFEGRCSLLSVEPIEKRPFFHYRPGKKYLAVGFYGCSFKCGFCLPGDTLISTPDGLKRIDQIQAGDEIFAVDNSTDAPQLVKARVGHVADREVEEVIELEVDGQTIQLTPEHPVMTRRGWVEAKDLTVDDEVLCDKTYLEQLRSQQKNEEKGQEKKG